MINEVQLIVIKGDATNYTSNIFSVSVPLQKIYLSETTEMLPCEVYQQLIDEQGFVDVYGESGLLDSVQIVGGALNCDTSPFSGTLEYVSANPSLIADGAYFNFQLGNPKQYYIDLYENESISQNWSFTNISELQVIGSYSREFRIPLTERNQEVFGSAGDVNYLSEVTTDSLFNKKVNAEIRVDTLPIMRGHLRVMKAFKQRDKHVDILVAFYSETPDLARAIGDRKLKDITTISSLDHICDADSVTDTTQDYLYSLMDWGHKWSGEFGSGYGPYFQQTTPRAIFSSEYPVNPVDLTPSVKWSWLFDAIIKDAGFTYDADELMTILENYYLPWRNRFLITDQNADTMVAQLTSNQLYYSNTLVSSLVEQIDIGDNFASDTYTASVTGYHMGSIFIQGIAPSGTYTAAYRSIDFFVVNTTTGQEFNIGNFLVTEPAEVFFYSLGFNILFNEGDEVRFKFRVYNYDGNEVATPITLTGFSDLYNGTSIIVRYVGSGYYGTAFIDMQELAPDIKQIDLLRDVIKMHNLAVIPDRQIANRIIFKPMNDYLASGSVLDWTNKLDISKDIVIESTADLQRNEIKFTYSSGGDVSSKFFVDKGQRVYGDYKITGYQVNSNTPPNQFAQGSIEVKLVTQSTPCQEIEGTNTPIPKFINDKGAFVQSNMRCLYDAGSIEIQLRTGINISALTPIRVFNHYSTALATFSDYDLNFAPETPLHDIISNPPNNLFNLYWRDYLNAIYSPQARVMTASFALDLTDILTFSFSDKIWIKDAYWRILDITDYKVGGSDSTIVKLIKLTDSTFECDVVPVGSELSGAINWEDLDGNPAEGNATCCNRLNYFWNNAEGICYAAEPRMIFNITDRGANSLNVINAPINSLKSVMKLDASQSSQFSVFAGTNITIDNDNIGTLAAGRSLTLEGENKGAILLGKNVLAKSGGMHIGGGWMNNSFSNADGGQQSGLLICANKELVLASGDTLEMPIESIANNRINLPDSTGWTCIVSANVRTNTDYGYYVWSVYLDKDALGVATASTPNMYVSDSALVPSVNLLVDVVSDPSEHRLLLEFTGGGLPEQIYAMMTIQYHQLRV